MYRDKFELRRSTGDRLVDALLCISSCEGLFALTRSVFPTFGHPHMVGAHGAART